MSLWLRTRRAGALLAALAFVVLTYLAAGDATLPMPAILAGQAMAVPVVLLAPLALSSVLGWGLMSGEAQLERVSSRPIARLDAALAAGVALLAWILGWIGGAVVASPHAAAAGRNALGYVGLMLIGRQVLGDRAGPLLPAVVAVFMAVFGGDASGQPRRWAWVLAPSDDPLAWTIALACLALGVAATVGGPRIARLLRRSLADG